MWVASCCPHVAKLGILSAFCEYPDIWLHILMLKRDSFLLALFLILPRSLTVADKRIEKVTDLFTCCDLVTWGGGFGGESSGALGTVVRPLLCWDKCRMPECLTGKTASCRRMCPVL